MLLKGGQNTHGISIGVLCLESYYGKIPGHIKNATTFDFPVVYKVVEGATPEKIVKHGDKTLTDSFIRAAQELEKEGVNAITGSCGFLALIQREIADAVNVPVYISSLIQVPLVYRMLKSNQKVGLLVAQKKALTREHLLAVGAADIPVCVAGMDGKEEFCDVIIDRKRSELDTEKLQKEVLEVVRNMQTQYPEMGALVIECTDLPPYACRIQDILRVPVFDVITLTNMVHQALIRKEYDGYMPPRLF